MKEVTPVVAEAFEEFMIANGKKTQFANYRTYKANLKEKLAKKVSSE